MDRPELLISSRTYSSWSLRGWLLCCLAGLDVAVRQVALDDPAVRAELLLTASSVRLPTLHHEGVTVWDTLAIGEYLNERFPEAQMLPAGHAARALSRSICGEMHAGFAELRSALPMNLKARHRGFALWSGVQADIARIGQIWRECLSDSGGPFLFGPAPTMADAMYAPVATRFVTYDVSLDRPCRSYVEACLGWAPLQSWIAAAAAEPDEIEELDADF